MPTPTAAQLAWQEAELGVVFHYDLHLFTGERYHQATNRRTPYRDASIFAPSALDTDQWVAAAQAAGARFAILTASHETGFRLWQSDANPFCLKAASWGNGRRDLVAEFVASCRQAGIRPGIYLGARWNGQLGVLDFRVTERSPLTQVEYNRLIEAEVEEICSRYGDLFEVWFDGGILAPADGGPDVLPIFEKHQPNCLFYHSNQRRDARWGGTETGTVGDPCWARVDLTRIETGEDRHGDVRDYLRHGDADGSAWCPAMSDAPLRNHEWFWTSDDEHKLEPLASLVNMYYQSVGRNSTLILGAVPDPRGLVPAADVARLAEFGAEMDRRLRHTVASTTGHGDVLELPFPAPAAFDHVVIQEDIRLGERVREYRVEALTESGPQTIASGTCVGHKRIHQIAPVTAMGLRLHITQRANTPSVALAAVCSA
jgi:alpha-L-fucosidase